jgi:hypothetical protein
MINPKDLINLPHGQAEAVLKREGCWAKKKFKVRVVGYCYSPPETKVITVDAYDRDGAQIEAERLSNFDEVDETEIIGEE